MSCRPTRCRSDNRYSVFAATQVETTTPRVERSGDAPSGTPLLTASGYVVARRKAVVSAKIQGRLADLRVEERVREGEVIARLESQDYDPQVRRAQAQVQQAEAQIASGRGGADCVLGLYISDEPGDKQLDTAARGLAAIARSLGVFASGRGRAAVFCARHTRRFAARAGNGRSGVMVTSTRAASKRCE
jgi:HlyD family secretion protein